MERKLGVWIALAMLCFLGAVSPAMADWVDVTESFGVLPGNPVTNTVDTGTITTVSVKVTFSVDADAPIMGDLRLLVAPLEGTPAPINTDGDMGADGLNNASLYYTLPVGDDGELLPGEFVTVAMELAGAVNDPAFDFSVIVNDASVDATIFRKKISRTPEFFSGGAAVKDMPLYVPARSTQGYRYTRDAASGDLIPCCPPECLDGTADPDDAVCGICQPSCTEFARVKPIVVTFVQEEELAPFNSVPGYDPDGNGIDDEGDRYAHDVYAAVSYDEGLTWKRRNISRTALKSSFTLPNGVEYPGDSDGQDLTVVGPYVFVTWSDKFCRSGDPWGLADAGIEDLYQVTGSQKSVDYEDVKGDEEPRPDLGVRPFSCIWAARGVLDQDEASPTYGTIVWFKAEQLSSGRRDAYRNFNAGVEPVFEPTIKNPVAGTGGFAVSWQEDPKGLKTGKGRGPGAGMSGACVNHKTDIWYSYIPWEDFAAVDEAFVSSSSGDSIQDGDGDPMSEYLCTSHHCTYAYDPEVGDEAHGIPPGTAFIDLPDTWVCPLCGAAKDTFEKDAKPHALVHFHPPVPVTDNAVCRERTATPVYGFEHIDGYLTAEGETCDYYYEGGTNSQPLTWDELPGDWQCPKCGGTKTETFKDEAEFIKNRNEGAPYCAWFADNPRVDGDGNAVLPGDSGYEFAYYTTESGEPLDGNTGASRANLSLVNWQGQTLAIMAYEETKGVGTGSDKEAAAMEQAAPYPLVKMTDGTWEAGATNSDCRSCHYNHVVPRDRYIPMATEADCLAKGATWDPLLKAYFPYQGYPLITDAPLTDLPEGVSTTNPATGTERCVSCVKFFGGRGMYPRDWARTDPTGYYNLPDHMPGWHQAALDCTSCHLPYNTKDADGDYVLDRADKCLGTPEGEPVDTEPTSAYYGCAAAQDPFAPDNNKDEPDRFRHGKNVYYHHFAFNAPSEEIAIAHGDQINGFSRDVVGQNPYGDDILWTSPGNYDPFENARRVRVVPNALLDETDPGAVTLGLLYKEGKDGQGAPADAILRLFRGGFDIANMDEEPLNLSASTPYRFQDPLDAGNEDGSGDNPAGDGTGDMLPSRNTPKIDYYYWTDANLRDPTGYWLKDADGGNRFGTDGYTPDVSGNPFENVFSTRLAIHGDTVLAGYAYCANWSAGKKAKDHYDFYIRLSEDAGNSWTLPVNVSRLKNHEESVSDCRVILTPPSPLLWNVNGQGIPFSQTGAPAVESAGDFNDPTVFFVGVGTKMNTPQPSPNETELEEEEIFLDVFYSRARIDPVEGLLFETFAKENPKYVENSLPYLDPWGGETDSPCFEGSPAEGNCIPNQPNPAYPQYVDEFNWLAKGDANQGDLQFACNPMGSRLYTIWEQDLPVTDEDGRKHFQGSDVWFRQLEYPEPGASDAGDVDGDGVLTWDDGRAILDAIGTTAYEADFLWAGDYDNDHRISGRDYNRWKRIFTKDSLNQQMKTWRAE